MKWFDGKIPDAIQVSKRNGSLFMVYVYGKDDMSQQMNSTWDSETVSKCLEENGAVAVKIESTSEECKFFSQIYPVVVVPSVFCIGEGGVPLEVIGGHVQPDEFVNKLKQVEQMHAAQKSSNTPPTPNTGQQTASSPTDGQVNPPGASNEASTSQTGASGDPAVPLEEKVERKKTQMKELKEQMRKKKKRKKRKAKEKIKTTNLPEIGYRKNFEERQVKFYEGETREEIKLLKRKKREKVSGGNRDLLLQRRQEK
ncbi:UBX domain-containing protein 4-like, partial [Ruditapes philippinarum]|uniref:UBX domain-containing protein 4-like n=1 Tax=Ruditapes philippinarum TaxID=129788 RepID=UPI00295C389B